MKRAAGFSLVEVLCATLILGVGLVGMTQGIVTALRSNKEAEFQTSAALIASAQIELLRVEGLLVEGEEEGLCEEPLALYRWRRSITGASLDGLYEVTVVIENSKTEKAIYELRTLLFDPPYYGLGSTDEETDPRSSRYRTGRAQ